MDEAKLIELYKEGMDSIISSVKNMHNELTTQISVLNEEIIHLKKENMDLKSKFIDLEGKMNKNSNNSSKPPSSGPFNKPTNSRKKTGKKTGGQKGHKGTTLLKVENPDKTIENKLDVTKCDCGCDLSNVDSYTRARQVFDIPKIVILVTEYRSEQKECPKCKKIHKAGFPQEVMQPVQYGENHWVHSASTEKLTHYAMHKKRGADATEEIGILTDFEGVAVHDHWKPYYKYTDCYHAECNAHHLRALRGIYENSSFEWANNMIGLLVEIKKEVDQQKSNERTHMPEAMIRDYELKYQDILNRGRLEDKEKSPLNLTKRGKPQKSESLKLINRIEKYNIETLSFMYDFKIPFDNNLAERDIRMVKLRQKISGCFRSEDGGDVFCKIRGYISTCRKNGLGVMDSIKEALKGSPFIPALA